MDALLERVEDDQSRNRLLSVCQPQLEAEHASRQSAASVYSASSKMDVLLERVKNDQSRNGLLSVCQPLSDPPEM